MLYLVIILLQSWIRILSEYLKKKKKLSNKKIAYYLLGLLIYPVIQCLVVKEVKMMMMITLLEVLITPIKIQQCYLLGKNTLILHNYQNLYILYYYLFK